jgi:hypothetical protein
MILLISASCVARIIGTSHWYLAIVIFLNDEEHLVRKIIRKSIVQRQLFSFLLFILITLEETELNF